MTLTYSQQRVLSHLRSAYVGPEGGDDEVIWNMPSRQYAVGMLYPQGAVDRSESDEAEDVDGTSGSAMVEANGELEDRGAAVPILPSRGR